MNKLIISILISLPTFAQLDSSTSRVFKISPLQIFDFENTFSVAYEARIKERKSIQFEAGYGYSNLNLWLNLRDEYINNDEKFLGIHILKSRAEFRRYFRSNPNDELKNLYYGVEVFGKHNRGKDELRIGREVIAGQASYWENVEGTSKKTVLGSHFKVGLQNNLHYYVAGKKNNWVFDAFLGLGFRAINKNLFYPNMQANDIKPRNIKRTLGTFEGMPEGWRPVISGVAGVKIGFFF